jgi:hypothetical protein
MSDCNGKCDDCGRFMSDGTWADIYDFVAMECAYCHFRCPRCTEALGPAQSNARPYNGNMRPYQGRLDGGEVASDSDSGAERENAERSGAVEAVGPQSGGSEASASPSPTISSQDTIL